MTTKQQEREALAKIRKIVESLGENSYIGTAFKGCWEDAEANIEMDAAFSLKGRLVACEEENMALKRRIASIQQEHDETKSLLMERSDALTAVLNEKQDIERGRDIIARTSDERWGELSIAKLEIIRLKAKLYDMMTAGDYQVTSNCTCGENEGCSSKSCNGNG